VEEEGLEDKEQPQAEWSGELPFVCSRTLQRIVWLHEPLTARNMRARQRIASSHGSMHVESSKRCPSYSAMAAFAEVESSRCRLHQKVQHREKLLSR